MVKSMISILLLNFKIDYPGTHVVYGTKPLSLGPAGLPGLANQVFW